MTRFWLVLALFVLGSNAAVAQDAKGIEVYEFGTYAAAGPSFTHAPSRQGIKIEGHAGYIHMDTTRTVVARLGARFGFRYRVLGTPADEVASLRMVWKFPKPGIIGADPHKPIRTEITEFGGSSNENYIITMSLESVTDLVPGIWTFEIWSGNHKLTEQSFEVIEPLIS